MSIKDSTAALQEILAAVNNLPSSAVLYTEQTLTEAQQAQARTNINAGLPALTIKLISTTIDGEDSFTHDSSLEEISLAIAENRTVQCSIAFSDTEIFVLPFVAISNEIALFAITDATVVKAAGIMDDKKAVLIDIP